MKHAEDPAWPLAEGVVRSNANSVVVFLLIFLPAIFLTVVLDVLGIFEEWLWRGELWFLDELAAMLLLCALPYMTYLVYRLFRLNQDLHREKGAIRRLHQRHESILQSVGIGIFGLDEGGRITFVNAAATRILGTTAVRLKEGSLRTLLGTVREEENAPWSSLLEETLVDGKIRLDLQERFRRGDGTLIPVSCGVSSLDPEAPTQGAVVTFQDITLRQQTEMELHRLANAVNQTAEMIVIIDPDGVILYVNAAFESMTGHRREEAIGTNLTQLPGDGLGHQWNRRIAQALSQGVPFRQRHPAARRNGAIFQADIAWSPVRDPEGRITSHCVVGRDVTHELELERQLRKSQRLEAVGTLAGGIAHDFNNILTVILSYTELTMDDLIPDSLEYRNLKEVMTAGNRAKELVKQLLVFSRGTEQERTCLTLSREIRGTMPLIEAGLPETIRLQVAMSPLEEQVLADPTRIRQLVMNLCTNAAEAMALRGGVIHLVLERVVVDREMIATHPALSRLQPGPHMVLGVGDQGAGISPPHLERLFEPFFTTKNVGKGSGLGLSVVHGIVQSFDGAITVRSVEGQGSWFQVFLPAIGPRQPGSMVQVGQGNDEHVSNSCHRG
ncbi:MAG: PAS domain S-box protein [Magnetococcales bacterium]|nr:PAS domain S-box protein [Magnetococcales bacterium]